MPPEQLTDAAYATENSAIIGHWIKQLSVNPTFIAIARRICRGCLLLMTRRESLDLPKLSYLRPSAADANPNR